MNKKERRRYFRIDDTVGLQVRQVKTKNSHRASGASSGGDTDVTHQFDARIAQLIEQMRSENPATAELAELLNQKLNQLADLFKVDSQIVDRVAHRVQQVNISACGLAFYHHESLAENSLVDLDIELLPGDTKIQCEGIVIASDLASDGDGGDDASYYCRIDFCSLSVDSQEALIQHIVQSQSAQLQARRAPD